MCNFPKWLPEAVKTYCKDKFESGTLTESQEECIIRLTTYETMHPIWEALSRETSDSEKLVGLIEFIRLQPIILHPPFKTHKLSAAKQRKVMRRISDLSERLLTALSQLSAIESDANNGVELLKSELYRMQKQAVLQQDGVAVVELHQLIEGLETAESEHGIAATLKTLQLASKYAINSPPDGPTKLGAMTASRTEFIKELKRYIQSNFGKKLNQVIATIVNTAMNLPPETVTEDMVRKAYLPSEDFRRSDKKPS